MDCRTAQSLVTAYINRTLTMDELEQFLSHVESCPSCYDELEIYYTVYYAMQRLDNGRDEESFNISELLGRDINRRKRRVIQYKIQKAVLIVAIFIMVLLIANEIGKMMGIVIF